MSGKGVITKREGEVDKRGRVRDLRRGDDDKEGESQW